MALRRPMPGEYNGPKEEPFSDRGLESEFPTLYEYLTSRNWADGSARLTTTLLIFVDNGVLRVCVNDRDNNRSAFVTATTLAAALASIETRLCGETMEWRFKAGNAGNASRTPF